MISLKKIVTVGILCLSLSSAVQSQDKKVTLDGKPFQLMAGVALELGGEKFAEFLFDDGSTQSMRTAQGGTLYVGAQYQFPSAPNFLIRGSVGIKYVTTKADNAHVRLTRVPLVFTANYMLAPKWRFGAGISMHTGIKFNGDGVINNFNFKSASGPTFELAYSNFGLTYTAMTYKDLANRSYGANAIGLNMSFTFKGKKTITTVQ
ncbi:MAG: hypothetical protein ACOVQE_00670 [Chitinophagaceae bacterium]